MQIRVGNTQAIGQVLIDCEIDLALVEGQVNDPRIVAAHWRDDELQIIAPPHHPLARRRRPSVNELNTQVWLVREPGSGTREVTDRLMRTQRIEPERTIEFGSNEGIARAVAAGLGVAMLPVLTVRELLRMGEVRSLNPLHSSASALKRPLQLLQLRERPPSALVRAFCELLNRVLEKH